MSNELRRITPGVYEGSNGYHEGFAEVSSDTTNGGLTVEVGIPHCGCLDRDVCIKVPLDILVDILESQGYIVAKADETPEEAHISNEPARL